MLAAVEAYLTRSFCCVYASRSLQSALLFYGLFRVRAGASTLTGAVISAGGMSVTSSTVSTTTGTGALVVTGGVGIGGAAFLGSTLNVAGPTPTSTDTACVSNRHDQHHTSSYINNQYPYPLPESFCSDLISQLPLLPLLP